MKKVFKEPLFIFLLLGGAMFVLFAQVSGNSLPDNAEIVVTQGQINALQSGFEKTWRRSPTTKEKDGLIQNYIREEVFYREALAMGLDREDSIVRRRLRQKMEFISEDIAKLDTPDEQELQTFLTAHHADYRQPSRFSFTQIYFNTSKRGQAAEVDAKAVLQSLQGKDADVTKMGDPLMLKQKFINETEREIERTLGSKFLQALRVTQAGSWQGPITSGFGLHLVRIDKRVEGQLPALNDVRKAVMRDWSLKKSKQTNEAFYEALRKRYQVRIESEKLKVKS